MRKTVVWLLLLALVCGLAGCGKEGPAKAEPEDLAGLYSLTLPEGEWRQPGPNIWVPVQEGQMLTDVRLWLVRLEDCSQSQAEEQLLAQGFAQAEEIWQKQEDGQASRARLQAQEQDCWLVYYSCPEAAADWTEALAAAIASFEVVEQ